MYNTQDFGVCPKCADWPYAPLASFSSFNGDGEAELHPTLNPLSYFLDFKLHFILVKAATLAKYLEMLELGSRVLSRGQLQSFQPCQRLS